METGSLQSLFVILFVPLCRISMCFSLSGCFWDKQSKLVISQFNIVVVQSFEVILPQTKTFSNLYPSEIDGSNKQITNMHHKSVYFSLTPGEHGAEAQICNTCLAPPTTQWQLHRDKQRKRKLNF